MKKALKKRWVDALLSGDYKQGFYFLHNEFGYCCLGVLRDVADAKDKGSYCGTGGILSLEQIRRFGLTREQASRLANLNDNGVPFDMIAGLIDTAL